ncbi:hypothetical protein Goklo_005696, partial [Gossypium klotzschianum]|nr:hypothetical protein [Gossypium klotzschianum]
MLAVKRDLVLKSIFQHAESSCPANFYAFVVRYCSNFYHHYNNNITPK